MFPLHTWLPDAHTDAPTAVSVMLAGVLIKMGGYGMIRLCVSMFPQVAIDYAQILIILALAGLIYGAAVPLMQNDIKRMIAYSSISHMGYVLLGIFALGQVSLTGAALQMFSHGIVTGLLSPQPGWSFTILKCATCASSAGWRGRCRVLPSFPSPDSPAGAAADQRFRRRPVSRQLQ
jgi:NADH:ubiquinone oxidoreductase subunit 4 (subunit M)